MYNLNTPPGNNLSPTINNLITIDGANSNAIETVFIIPVDIESAGFLGFSFYIFGCIS